ncbi:ATP-binding protein [Desulfurivibrio dismutans]|uniref:ATP-binding protein n=1 Tax=Desulfurivibrio dismutans TaxID=1398908 RepID=UPI0023DBB52C|nr:ATP-binding protein [Desulfurivibrio alkaliphilus]MDF1614368.1 ATP-binding protein [Desulfurivibrio alkaliphilus]
MQGMKSRACAKLLHELLSLFPCVALVGVRQCGKTTLLGQLPPPWQLFDLEKTNDFEAISRDPDLFLRLHPNRVAIDEAQLLPPLFNSLRVAIDADRSRAGRFLITGSSSPDLLGAISESLAGRVAILELAPFSFAEVQQPEPGAGIAPLIADPESTAHSYLSLFLPKDSLRLQHDYWFGGGYPEPWLKHSPRFSKLWMENYIQTYLNRDIQRLFPGLNRQKFLLFLQMLGSCSGTIINYSDVARALGVSQPTARDYFQIAHGTFIWRHIPAFAANTAKRLVKHPKGYLRDSGLLHFLLHLRDSRDLLAHPAMGRSWEGMVIEEILRGLNSLGLSFDYFHYRTSGGAEVDLVLQGEFGLIPIEIKYGQRVGGHDLRGIRDFIKQHGCRYGLVINNDERVRLYDDTLVGIPFGCRLGV